jgi:hypothetical protein
MNLPRWKVSFRDEKEVEEKETSYR